MPRTLTGKHGSIKLTNLQYGLAMKMVYDLGWKPAGTLPPRGYSKQGAAPDDADGLPPWPAMNYFAAAGQRVSDADAKELGARLEDMLLDIPDHDAMYHKVQQIIILPPLGELRLMKPGAKLNVVEFFSGRNKGVLRKYAEFAQRGGFAITG